MKKVILLSALTVSLFACSSEKNEHDHAEVEVKAEVLANAEAKFNVDGMTCQVGCAARIEDKLNKMDGVSEASVDFDTKEALISYDNKVVTEADFKKMIESIGDNQYKVVEANAETEVEGDDTESETESGELSKVITNLDFELPNILDFFTNIL